MIQGLTLPLITEPDPEIGGEGSLDPLGLETIADKLANEIAPGITARMWRVRFATAIAVASVANEALEEVMPGDGKSTPQLAFEWLLSEALARDRDLPAEATIRVPGIGKARAAVSRRGHLDSRSYLQTPKVFGFHGVYKRLAFSLGIVDDGFILAERGDRLVRTWEREQGLPGYTDRVAGTDGGAYCQRLESAVKSALLEGSVQASPKLSLWRHLVGSLRPDTAGPEERRLLRDWLLDSATPLRRELILAVEAADPESDETNTLKSIRRRASTELATRLDAIDAYEAFGELIQRPFEVLQYLSTTRGLKPLSVADIGSNTIFRSAVTKIPKIHERVVRMLEPLGFSAAFEVHLGSFGEVRSGRELFDVLQERHDTVQKAKPPVGKRPWFDEGGGGIVVRYPYRLDEPPELTGRYIHPFRITAIRSFLQDLQ